MAQPVQKNIQTATKPPPPVPRRGRHDAGQSDAEAAATVIPLAQLGKVQQVQQRSAKDVQPPAYMPPRHEAGPDYKETTQPYPPQVRGYPEPQAMVAYTPQQQQQQQQQQQEPITVQVQQPQPTTGTPAAVQYLVAAQNEPATEANSYSGIVTCCCYVQLLLCLCFCGVSMWPLSLIACLASKQTEKMNAQEDYLSARQCSRLTRVTILCVVLIPITIAVTLAGIVIAAIAAGGSLAGSAT